MGCGDDDGGNDNNNNNSGTRCGNGTLDGDEQCDDGAANSDTEQDACRADCRRAWCGDGVQDEGEACDDGNDSNNDACLTACGGAADCCAVNMCGDGFVNETLEGGTPMEVCDDGDTLDSGACRGDCGQLWADCGDRNLDPGEICDNGGQNSDLNPNACREDCSLPRCGDNVHDDDYLEECDSGLANDDVTPDACRTDCREASCGDDVVDSGEECDHGVGNSDTAPNACREDCMDPDCGDSVVDDALGEVCDDGLANSDAPDEPCRVDCLPRRCGDGIVDPNAGETCDDASTLAGDGCSPTCTTELYYQCSGAPSQCVCRDHRFGTGCSECRVWVNGANTGAADGDSASTGYPDLQTGIDEAAAVGPICEVWVVSGEYVVKDTAESDTVRLASGVGVYGGFAGWETERLQRDAFGNPTVLNGSDGSVQPVWHVVTAIGSEDATLDGFEVMNGHADGTWNDDWGGGIYVEDSTVILRNLYVHGNTAAYYGGGLYVRNSAAWVENSIFSQNHAERSGGGLNITYTDDVTVVNCTIADNTLGTSGSAGGIQAYGSQTTVLNSIVWGNAVESFGVGSGGSFVVEYSDIENTTVWPGLGNLNADPLFVSSTLYELDKTSPCIDVANDTVAPPNDLMAQERVDVWFGSTDIGISGTWADMGAIEMVLVPCDLSGYELRDNSTGNTVRTFASGFEIPRGGLLVLARNSNQTSFEAHWGVTLGSNVQFLDYHFRLVINGDEFYSPYDSSDVLVDGPTIAQDSNAETRSSASTSARRTIRTTGSSRRTASRPRAASRSSPARAPANPLSPSSRTALAPGTTSTSS